MLLELKLTLETRDLGLPAEERTVGEMVMVVVVVGWAVVGLRCIWNWGWLVGEVDAEVVVVVAVVRKEVWSLWRELRGWRGSKFADGMVSIGGVVSIW